MTTTIRSTDTHVIESLRNRALNPNGAATVGFSANSANYTASRGVAVPAGNPQGITTGVRGTSNIGGTTVMSMYNVDALSNTAPARQIGAWFWANRAGLVATFRAGDTITPLAVNAWTWVTGYIPASIFAGANVYKADGVATDAGALAYITGVTVLTDDPPTEAIWGSRPAAGERSYAWAGATNASESIEYRRVPLALIEPKLVLDDWVSDDTPGTILHPILNREYPDITLRPATARTGLMKLLFWDSIAADAARRGLRLPQVFLTTSDLPWMPDAFVPTGIHTAQQSSNSKRWVVEVAFQEVAP